MAVRATGSSAVRRRTLPQAGIVVNPTKVGDPEEFRRAVSEAMHSHGWQLPLWLETTAEDPGQKQAREAAAAGVELVLACGGDGTVTACAEGVAGTGTPLGIVPIGTGNLLARNLDLPVDLDEALIVELTGKDTPIDAGTANGAPLWPA